MRHLLPVLFAASTVLVAQSTIDKGIAEAGKLVIAGKHGDALALVAKLLESSPAHEELLFLRLVLAQRTAAAEVVGAAQGYERALPAGAAKDSIGRVARLLAREAPPNAEEFGSAIELVRFLRTNGRAEQMLPLLLHLRATYPNELRVLYGLGEATGVASNVFEPAFARQCFERMLELLPLDPRDGPHETQADALAALAMFIGADLSKGPAALRQKLLAFLERLGRDTPIGLWKLRDRRLPLLVEQVAVARERGQQMKMLELANQMESIQSGDPIVAYALAATRCSYGPAFDKAEAMRWLERFLALTEEQMFRARAADDPEYTRESLARELRRVHGEGGDDLGQRRIDVLNWLEDLKDGKRLLIAPDRAALATALADLTKKVREREAKRADAQAKIATWENELVGLRQKLKESYDADGITDAIRKRTDGIARAKKELKPIETELPPLIERKSAFETRLASMRG